MRDIFGVTLGIALGPLALWLYAEAVMGVADRIGRWTYERWGW